MVSFIASKVVKKNNRDYVGWAIFVAVESLILECQVAFAMCSSSVLSSKLIVVQHKSLSRKWSIQLLAGVDEHPHQSRPWAFWHWERYWSRAVCRRAVARNHQLHHLLREWLEAFVLWISADNHVAKTWGDMSLVHCCVRMLRLIDLVCACLKVSVDDKRHW